MIRFYHDKNGAGTRVEHPGNPGYFDLYFRRLTPEEMAAIRSEYERNHEPWRFRREPEIEVRDAVEKVAPLRRAGKQKAQFSERKKWM